MNKTHLQQLQKSLEEEKAMIEAQLNRIAKPNPSIRGDWKAVMIKSDQSDPKDEQAHNITSYETRRAVEQQLEERLIKITAALARINTGTYGVCIDCKTDIPHQRLIAVPVTARCMECKNKQVSSEV